VLAGQLPDELAETLKDEVATIASLTVRIRNYDRRIEHLSKERYPQRRPSCSGKFREWGH
jgi:hypothetical protein